MNTNLTRKICETCAGNTCYSECGREEEMVCYSEISEHFGSSVDPDFYCDEWKSK